MSPIRQRPLGPPHSCRGRQIVSETPRIEFKFVGAYIHAEGIAGIIGAVTIAATVLAFYFGS